MEKTSGRKRNYIKSSELSENNRHTHQTYGALDLRIATTDEGKYSVRYYLFTDS